MPIHIKRIKMSLREKLEKIREDLNLTVAEIARRLEISRAGWYKLLEVEEKEKDICYSLCCRVAILAGVKVDEIFLPFRFAYIVRKRRANHTSKKAHSNNDSTKGAINNG